MATNPFFSGRIPQELYDAIELHREKSGESKTDVLVRALSAYVNLPTEISSAEIAVRDTRLESLESRMAQMEEILLSLQLSTSTQAQAETVQGQMSIEDISISDNNLDNSADNLLSALSTNVIEADKGTDNTEEIQEADNNNDNNNSDIVIKGEQVEFWTTNQIQSRLGISRAKLDYWDKVGKLPHTENGYIIKKLVGKQKQKSHRSEKTWEVCKADPPPDEAEDF